MPDTTDLSRRGFLATILALGVAPAIVRAESLMPVRVLEAPRVLLTPPGQRWQDYADTGWMPSADAFDPTRQPVDGLQNMLRARFAEWLQDRMDESTFRILSGEPPLGLTKL